MSWPYHFVDLTEDEIIKRRIFLDRYGLYAQLSALVPILAFQLYRLGIWVLLQRHRAKISYTGVPSSPIQKQDRESTSGGLAKRWRSILWWLGGEVYPEWGLRGHWLIGLTWASWLLYLAVDRTGDDYMHVTKRFGHVAASQFPLHYMLSMKSLYSPLAIAFRSSHEQLNAYHRISGRIIYCLLVLHASFYINFFAQHGIIKMKFSQTIPILGALSIILLTVLATTSLASIRRWSYRVFFVFHLTIAVLLMTILFFHASPLRFFTVEALSLFVLDVILRKFDTVTAKSRVISVKNTELVKLSSPIPASKIGRFNMVPGQHVYLSIPPESVQSKLPILSIHQLLFNPFTVADVSPRGILLVLRTLHGPMTTALKQLTASPSQGVDVIIEGPYGVARQFPDFTTQFDRILLVAGGVGATFILPIYHRITAGIGNESSDGSRIELIWAMRSLSETSWVADTQYASVIDGDGRVKIYVTGANSGSSALPVAAEGPQDGSVLMDDLSNTGHPGQVSGGYLRPNLKSIVDKTFRQGLEERVAVLVCGPSEMAHELRKHVGQWVAKGRDVWWHDESFGW